MTISISDNHNRFSPSQLDAYKDCPQKWKYMYVDGWKRKGLVNRAFDKGGYFHELAHVYYQLLKVGERAAGDPFYLQYIQSRIKRDLSQIGPDHIETLSAVLNMMNGYIPNQSSKIDKGIEVVEVEMHLEHVLQLPNGIEFILHGYADLLYRDRAGILICRDHKTGEKATWNQSKVALSSQLAIYALLYELITGNRVYNVEVSWINSFQYTKPQPVSKMFGLYPYEHNDRSLESFKSNVTKQVETILNAPITRALNNSCSFCPFQQVCEFAMKGFDYKGLLNTYFERKPDEDSRSYDLGKALAFSSKNPDGNTSNSRGGNFTLKWGKSSP